MLKVFKLKRKKKKYGSGLFHTQRAEMILRLFKLKLKTLFCQILSVKNL